MAEPLEYHEGLEPLRTAGRKGRKKRRPGHNLALRLRDVKTETLRFLHDPGVPFTNNQAERDLRMMKLRMKISGALRAERGAQDFAPLRSVLSTARKQGRNRIETLVRGPAVLAGARTRAACSPRHVGTRPRCVSPIQPSGSANRRRYLGSYEL